MYNNFFMSNGQNFYTIDKIYISAMNIKYKSAYITSVKNLSYECVSIHVYFTNIIHIEKWNTEYFRNILMF